VFDSQGALQDSSRVAKLGLQPSGLLGGRTNFHAACLQGSNRTASLEVQVQGGGSSFYATSWLPNVEPWLATHSRPTELGGSFRPKSDGNEVGDINTTTTASDVASAKNKKRNIRSLILNYTCHLLT
jgi:hypothetical protein